jgi:ubiquinone/menaquinone biosynthesis C-methylase UbiE
MTPASPATPVPPATAPDLEALKTRQRAMWGSGDYAQIGTRLQIVGETLCEAADLRSGERVLDVAAGNGNASLAAARRFCQVTSTDYVPELLEKGRRRAEADGLEVAFQVADAEALPFAAGAFDVAISVFGVMFAPQQARAASELVRVVRPGGRIALASWTPEGFLGDLFRTMAGFVPPPPGVTSPVAWGSEARLVELFGPAATDLETTRRTYTFRFRSAAHFVETFRTYYGPTLKAFAALPSEVQPDLTRALTQLLERHDVGAGRGLVVPAEYLEAVITR